MKIKGSVITEIKKQIQDRGLEEKALQIFDVRNRNTYEKTLEISWVSVEDAGLFFQASAQLLFPGDSQGIRKLGIENSRRHFSGGIYGLIFKVLTVEMAIKKAAALWQRFHQKGEGKAYHMGMDRFVMEVTGYPELPDAIRQGVGGEILGLAELATKRSVELIEDFSDPNCWKWIVKM